MDTAEVRERLRAQAKARAGTGSKFRFDEGFRAEAVAYVRARQTEGGTQEEAARELGLSSWTLSRWHQRARSGSLQVGPPGGGGAAALAFVPVTVKREPVARSSIVVHGPGGVRVEGLTPEQVARLLRELSA